MTRVYYTLRDESIDRIRRMLKHKLNVSKLPEEVEDIVQVATRSVRVRTLEIVAFADLLKIMSTGSK